MSVIEAWPGGGWYTQVIAPYLKTGGGTYYAAAFSRENATGRILDSVIAFERAYAEQPETYGEVVLTALGGNIAPDGPVDAILTFRNLHNWQSQGVTEDLFRVFYDALKPGGVFGVVAHRADGAYDQRVALKVARLGYGSSDFMQRLERERALLARLEHPGIARLIDGATHSLTRAGIDPIDLDDHLAQLPEVDRRIVELRLFAGLEHREIAPLAGVSLYAVRKVLQDARRVVLRLTRAAE